jgi:hypothetical protein
MTMVSEVIRHRGLTQVTAARLLGSVRSSRAEPNEESEERVSVGHARRVLQRTGDGRGVGNDSLERCGHHVVRRTSEVHYQR